MHYNDIAVIEFGKFQSLAKRFSVKMFTLLERRIIFNYEKFGDSPPCLGYSFDIANLEALSQGVGKTEYDTHGDLLEAKIVTMSNQECEEWISYNRTKSLLFKASVKQQLPNGMSNDLLCTKGIYYEEYDIFSVSFLFLQIMY